MDRRLLLSLLLMFGCRDSGPPPADELQRDGQDATRQFFARLESGDCAQLEPLLARKEACPELVKEFTETRSHLSQIESAKIDGRDPHVVLVTVNVQSKKFLHNWIVRATWTADGWRMSL